MGGGLSAGEVGAVLNQNCTARVAPERQAANVRLLAVLSQSDVSTLETDMARKTYWELLRDPRWQRRRLEIMENANFACQTCQAADKTLNVHHRLYRKGAMPWDYSDVELVCLCEDCHEIEHRWRGALDEVLAKLDAGSLEFILGYAEGQLALNMEVSDLDRQPIRVRSHEHADGLLAALWNWNCGFPDRPDPFCLIDHEMIDGRVYDGLICGEMPLPRSKNGAD